MENKSILYIDADVTVLKWEDGGISAFFSHDDAAIKKFIAEKQKVIGNAQLQFTTKNIKKSEYDRITGFTKNI